MATATISAAPGETTLNPWVIAGTVTIATFMEVLDTSIANVALPHIAGSLGVSQDDATWVLTTYLVANAIVLPLSGWLSATFGRKRYYMGCVVLFTVSSVLCCLEVVLDKGQEEDWFASRLIVTLSALAVIGLVGLVLWELHTPRPVVNFRLLKDRNFLCSGLLIFGLYGVMLGSTAMLPLML